MWQFILMGFLLLSALAGSAQRSQEPAEFVLDAVQAETPAAFGKLLYAEEAIRNDQWLNEELIDLVDAWTTDSVYSRKTERHQFFGAAPLRWLGVRWKTVRYTREKFVGTVIRTSISAKERFTEYDVNFNLAPHLPEHRQRSFEAYRAQSRMFKARKKVREGEAPYIEPHAGLSAEPYKIHVEITPHRELRIPLHNSFYPTIRGSEFGAHHNTGDPAPAMGVYGPLVLDCNHKCHPEIHPYEWIWWLDLNEEESGLPSGDRVWHLGFMRDASNRFRHWSSSPRTGVVSFPFAFYMDAHGWEILIDHGPHLGFADNLDELDMPAVSFGMNGSEWVFTVNHQHLSGKKMVVRTNHPVLQNGYRWWLSDLTVDPHLGILSGRVNLAMSVQDAYTARLTTRSLK